MRSKKQPATCEKYIRTEGGQRLLVSMIKHRDVLDVPRVFDINLYHGAAICQLSNSR